MEKQSAPHCRSEFDCLVMAIRHRRVLLAFDNPLRDSCAILASASSLTLPGLLARLLTLRNGVVMPKYRLPVLNSLRAFEAAARHLSIKKGGDELHVNHAAVSKHINKLEIWLNCSLFERHHRKIVLTEEGEALFGALTVTFDYLQHAISRLSKNQHAERLVISVDPDFAALWLVPRFGDFSTLVPEILVEILAEAALKSFDNPRIDCAIHYAQVGLDAPNREYLFRSSLFPVCAPSVMEATPIQSPQDLRHHVLLHDRSILEWQEFLRETSVATLVNLDTGSIFSTTALCLEAAARGQGVAMGDDCLAQAYLSDGRLVRLFDYSVLSKNAYYFVVPEESASHPAVEAFRKWLIRGIDAMREPAHSRLKKR
jgi:LysR family glycine cleavage system transcriptional activator